MAGSAGLEAAAPHRCGRLPVAAIVWGGAVVLLYLVLWLDAPLSALDFPLNDDWSYARAVHTLLERGRYELTVWTSAPILPQVLWGALVCSLGGFSFGALRVSTLVVAALTVILLERWMRSLGAERRQAVLGAALLGFNPVFLALANSYMTDIPFAALLLVTLATIPHPRERLRLGAFTAACVVLTLQRHVGLAVPAAYLLYSNLRRGVTLAERLGTVVPLLAAWAAYATYRAVLQRTTGMPVSFDAQSNHLLLVLRTFDAATLATVARHALVALCFVGLFSLPLSIRLLGSLGWVARGLVVVLTAGIVHLCTAWNMSVPMTHNVWIDGGIGPLTLRDYFSRSLNTYNRLAPWLKRDLLWAAALGASLVLAACVRVARARGDRRRLLLLLMPIYALPLLLAGFFDRYLLPLLVLVLPLLTERTRSTWYWDGAGWAACALLALTSLAGTHEYLAWNRARWQVLGQLTEVRRIDPREIDGGIEFNGWHFCVASTCVGVEGKPWWWVQDDRWIVTFGPFEGYEEVFAVPYRRFGLAGPEERAVHALRRVEARAAPVTAGGP